MVQGFKRRLLFKVLVAVGLIALLALFSIVLNMDINKSELSIAASKEKLALRAKTIELLSSSNNDLQKAEPLLENLKTVLPTHDQLFSFKDELTKSAKSYSVTIGVDFPKGGEVPSTATEPGTVKFDMFLSGSYENLIAFLKTFEKHRYFIRMDAIEVIRTASSPSVFTLKTSGKIYIK